MNILLIAGGWSGEREVALSGARQIEKGLLALGHHVTPFDPARDLRALYEATRGQEFAFINLHGSPGEDGLIQCLLERIGMPYQGSDSRASLLALNKAVSKQIFEAAGLPTPAWEFVPASHVAEWRPLLPFPLVVKPNTGGSSLGVGIVASEDELEAYLAQPEIAGQDLLAEVLIQGQELTCGVLEGCDALPPILIRPKSGEFFDYESKYVAGATEEICPAPIPAELTERLQSMARAAHDALGLSDYSRADFMVGADGTPYLLEVNTLPGMTATSLLPQEALAVGLSFEQLLTRLVELGLRKKTVMPRPAPALGQLFGQLFGLVYTLLWCLAGPLAFISPRMRQGWKERLGIGKPAPCEIWIQGASAGECALVAGLLEHLQGVPVLATTCTSQGLDVLNRIDSPNLQTRMLPFDLPLLMGRMLDASRPKAVVLLETEIWPGLLMACAARGVPVIVVNARMTAKSLAGYLFLGPLLRRWAPQRIGAMAQADALRFGLIFGAQRTAVTGNIKFDRAISTPLLPLDENPLAGLIPRDQPFVVLGSVREQEEPQVLELIRQLRQENPECVIGLFPRHMHRIPVWQDLLARAGMPFALRSALDSPAAPGSVVLWDTFGEMNPAYALARRAFVGGSLARLGGQNFLEPLAQGVLPCVGPHTRNFDWVGEEIFDSLVFRCASIPELARFLLTPAPPRSEVRQATLTYVHARQGATAASMELIRPYLHRSPHA